MYATVAALEVPYILMHMKGDPDTMQIDEYNQLNGPYTYSDMTGWGLNNVANPPG